VQSQTVGEVIDPTHSQPRRLEVIGGQHHAPARLPAVTTRHPVYSSLDGLWGRSGRQEKSRPHRNLILGIPARSESLYRLIYRNRRKLSVPNVIQ
jgi:hypothetical protein